MGHRSGRNTHTTTLKVNKKYRKECKNNVGDIERF